LDLTSHAPRRAAKLGFKALYTSWGGASAAVPCNCATGSEVAYLQYVELKLTGAAIQRHRLAIPPSIQKLGGSEDLEGRLRTTFDLIEKGGKLSSKALEDALNDIRKNFTPSLGKDHGRVVLKAAKPHLEKRLVQFRKELNALSACPAYRVQGTRRARRYSAPHPSCLTVPAVLRRARAERTVVGGLLICCANAGSLIGLFLKALIITSSVVTKTGAAPGKA
jgi:hypothetical protein